MESVLHILFMVLILLVDSFVCEGGQSFQKNEFPTYGGKPPVKTIKQSNGDVVDCINIYDQPAFQHPLLRNHKIEMSPRFHPTATFLRENPSTETENLQGQEKIESCPDGTVPILREAMKRASNYTRPMGTFMKLLSVGSNSTNSLQSGEQAHQHAIFHAGNGPLYQINVTINVWNPFVEDGEHTTVELGVARRYSGYGGGWMVHKAKFGDTKTRLFISWNDNNQTGCDNLECPGFVQTSKTYYLGMELHPVSTYNGQQYGGGFCINKNMYDGHWWFTYLDVPIGYWPSSLVPDLMTYADRALFGGSVTINTAGHSRTQMGSGHFPGEGYGKVCFMKDLLVYGDDIHGDPGRMSTTVTDPSCYDAKDDGHWPTGRGVYLGGPGCY